MFSMFNCGDSQLNMTIQIVGQLTNWPTNTKMTSSAKHIGNFGKFPLQIRPNNVNLGLPAMRTIFTLTFY